MPGPEAADVAVLPGMEPWAPSEPVEWAVRFPPVPWHGGYVAKADDEDHARTMATSVPAWVGEVVYRPRATARPVPWKARDAA